MREASGEKILKASGIFNNISEHDLVESKIRFNVPNIVELLSPWQFQMVDRLPRGYSYS